MLTSLFAAAAVAAVPPAGCMDSVGKRLEAQLTPALEQRAASGAFSGIVMVACNGTPVYSAQYGFANREKKIKNSIETRFNLGSMNKMWTAVAVAQLVERGKIDVNAPVGKYLPDLSNADIRDRVLIKHLLTHTSGLSSYFKRGFLRDHVVIKKAAELLPFFVDDPLDFTPGSKFQYSNAGFALLGVIVERVSGMNYFDYVRQNVLQRAGMKTAGFLTLPVDDPHVAVGYALPPGATDAAPNTDLLERSGSPAGGAYAAAADLVAFSRALWSGKLVGMETVKEFTTGKVAMGLAKYAYGFGEVIEPGVHTVGHNGGAPGVGAEYVSLPEQNVDVVVLTNIDMPEATHIRDEIVGIVTGRGGQRYSPMRDRVGMLEFQKVLQVDGNRLVALVNAANVGQLKVTIEVEPNALYRMLPRSDFNPYP